MHALINKVQRTHKVPPPSSDWARDWAKIPPPSSDWSGETSLVPYSKRIGQRSPARWKEVVGGSSRDGKNIKDLSDKYDIFVIAELWCVHGADGLSVL